MIFRIISLFIILFNTNTAFAEQHKVEHFTLSNGMQIVAIANSKVAAVSHMVWYKTGGIDEASGKSGIAHFLEHLLFKGTEKFPKGELSKLIARAGGNDNAFTSKDYTAYYQNISKDKLELVMQLESDRMSNVNFTEEDVTSERKVIVEERFSRVDSKPSALLREQMNASLFLNHPYGTPLIGWQHEIKNLSYNDAKNWYDKYYNPANAILIVSGDITADELKTLADKYYGKIPDGKTSKRPNIFEPKHNAQRYITLKNKKVTKPKWHRYYLAPSINYGDSQHSNALILLSHLLHGSRTSVLYEDLVVKNNLATNVGGYYEDLNLGPSVFAIQAEPSEGVPLAQLEQKIEENIRNIQQNGVSAESLKRAKNSLIADVIYAREDLKTMAYVYGQVLAAGADISYVDDWETNINNVTNAQIIAAAKFVLQNHKSVTGNLLPQSEK